MTTTPAIYATQNGDYDLTNSVSIFSKSNAANVSKSTFLRLDIGDGTKDLAAAVDTTLTIIILRGGKFLTSIEQVVPSAYDRKSIDTEQINWGPGELLQVMLSSDQAGDTDVDVTVQALESLGAGSSQTSGSIAADTISELAAGPKRVTGDEGTVEERGIDELIKADRYASAKNADCSPFGLRMVQMKYPGTQ